MKSLALLLIASAALAAPSPAPSIDTGGLSETQKDTYKILLDKAASPCGRAHSLATSLKPESRCARAPFAARFLVMLLKLGLSQPEIEEHYADRFITPKRGYCKPGGPVRGVAGRAPPVVICLFSDFQCPHCRTVDPLLKRVLDERHGDVLVVFKHFPIAALHPNARAAAAAAVAAGAQGKFWEMHDKLFANQDELGQADLERYARELKLDLAKWRSDAAQAGARVDADRAEGDALGVSRTPSLFIAGRLYRGPLKYEHILDWVDEELAAR